MRRGGDVMMVAYPSAAHLSEMHGKEGRARRFNIQAGRVRMLVSVSVRLAFPDTNTSEFSIEMRAEDYTQRVGGGMAPRKPHGGHPSH
jgi:hypothetical protein